MSLQTLPITLAVPPKVLWGGVVALAAAESSVASYTVVGTILVALLSLAGVVFTATFILRGNRDRNATDALATMAARDKAHDERADAEIQRLRTDIDRVTIERDTAQERHRDMQERHARLRLAVIANGLDPDQIIGPKGPTGGS